ncbi:uncharacterized protein LOC124292276 [Haliotis rubra]|uniref:uncharacterized protein LOC124292276 n=1 Tax=Haliotis rubra TaxID=36100 RepID=UPI001EE5CE0E|nr:uncharacterized protein LOC124292276 [Haliotis rubra]
MLWVSLYYFISFIVQVISTKTYYLAGRGKKGIDHILSSAPLSCVEECIVFCDGEKAVSENYDVTTGTCVCHSVFPEMLSLVTQANASMYANRVGIEAAAFGYIYNSSAHFFYKVHSTDKATWTRAREICQSEGGELAKLDTPEKRQLVQEIVQADGANEYFLGATDMAEDGVWRWVVDDTVFPEYTKSGYSKCLEMEPDMQFDDTSCNFEEQKYVCDIVL